MANTLQTDTSPLSRHPVIDLLRTRQAVGVFMRYQVFAVWDYMTLLKAMQQRFTGQSLPWRPAPWSGEVVRLINLLVLHEESDIDGDGRIRSHFESFLELMEQTGIPTREARQAVIFGDLQELPAPIRRFVDFTLDTAISGMDEELAAALLVGREAGIPEAYTAIGRVVGGQELGLGRLVRYCDRHVERDQATIRALRTAAEHELIGDDEQRRDWARASARRALELRGELWDAAAREIVQTRVDLLSDLRSGPAG